LAADAIPENAQSFLSLVASQERRSDFAHHDQFCILSTPLGFVHLRHGGLNRALVLVADRKRE